MPHTVDLLDALIWSTPGVGPGTLWTLMHDTEGVVTVNVGPHPHGYELRLLLNRRFLRSRVHRTLSDMLADAEDTRGRFEILGFEELPPSIVH